MSDWRMAVHYRNRAELLRVIAEETTQEEHSHALRKVAEFYDEMAATVERDTRAKASWVPTRNRAGRVEPVEIIRKE